LRSVRLGIVPMDTALPVPPLHGFYILDDHVLVETLHREASTDDPDDIALYGRIADAFWSVAATGDKARTIITRIAADLGSER
jgi:hypothetical protein